MRRWKVSKDHVKLFLGGMIWDAILTVDVVVTSRLLWLAVAATTFTITVLAITMYDKVLGRDNFRWDRVLTLATGSAVGAAITTALF